VNTKKTRNVTRMITPKQRWQNIKESWESIFRKVIDTHRIEVFYDIGFTYPFTTVPPWNRPEEVCEIILDKLLIHYEKAKGPATPVISFILDDYMNMRDIEDFDGPWLDFLENKAKEYAIKVDEAIETFPKRQLEKAERIWSAPPSLGRSE